MNTSFSALCIGAISLSAMAGACAQGFTIGDRVTCDGATGTIVRTEPRPGWDEPSSIVKIEGVPDTEYRCLQARMRAAPDTSAVAPTSARASGMDSPRGDHVAQPLNPDLDARDDATADAAETIATAATTPSNAPDGRYRCHKISPGGQLMDIGNLDVSGGRATMQGMPDGWVVRSVSVIGKDERGQPLVAVDYTSAAGWNDRLDCVPG